MTLAQTDWQKTPQSWNAVDPEIQEKLDVGCARFSEQIPDSPFGAHTVVIWETDPSQKRIEFQLQQFAATGMKWVKDYMCIIGEAGETPQQTIERWKKNPESLILPHYLQYCKTARSLGLKILLRVDGSLFYYKSGGKKMTPESIAAYREAMTLLVNALKDYIQDWEIDNEPNMGNEKPTVSPEDYVALVKAGYEGIKAADPHARVYAGATAMLQCLDKYPFPYIDRMLKAGLLNYCDVFSFHPYRMPYSADNIPEHGSEFHPWKTWGDYEKQIKDLKLHLKKASGKDFSIAATEVGYPADFMKDTKQRKITLQTQAKYDQRMMIMDHYLGVYPRINFAFKRQLINPYDMESNFSMISADWIRVPKYFASIPVCALLDSRDKPIKLSVKASRGENAAAVETRH
jgi:hypothetical protein